MSKDMFPAAIVSDVSSRRILFNEIRALYRSAEKSENECVNHLIALGEKLENLKRSCKHGEWENMLTDDLKIAISTASKARRAYRDQFKTLQRSGLTEKMAMISAPVKAETEPEESTDEPAEIADEPEPPAEDDIPPELAGVGEPKTPAGSVTEYSRSKAWNYLNRFDEQVDAAVVVLKLDPADENYTALKGAKKHFRAMLKKAESPPTKESSNGKEG